MRSGQLALDLVPPALSMAEQIVHDCIARVLPPGVPSYVHRIERVALEPHRVTADLRVWDGSLHTVEFWGFDAVWDGGAHSPQPKGVRGACLSMRWVGDTAWAPFGWDERAKRWRRYPEHAGEAY